MIKNILTILILFSVNSFANTNFVKEECSSQKIKNNIKRLRSFNHDSVYDFYTKYIYKYSKLYNIHCEIPILLLRVESNFTIKENKASGDISIAQINYEFWKSHYKKLFNKILSKKKLMRSNSYAIKNMFIILNYLKQTYKKRDSLWYLRYNSNYLLRRLEYLTKYEKYIYQINSNKKILNYKQKENLIRYAYTKYGWKKVMEIYTLLKDRDTVRKEYNEKVKFWRKRRANKLKSKGKT